MVPSPLIPAFHEDWFGQASQNALAGFVQQAPPGLIVEIGAWEGRSTVAMARAAHPRPVHTVDTWAGSPAEISSDLAARRDVHAQWAANVQHYTLGNVIEHRMGWRDYTPSGPVAVVFIDAEHTRIEVRDTILAFLPRMVEGGIICGDDAHHPPVQQGVYDCLPKRDVETIATLWYWRRP